MLLQEDLIQILPMISEANAISEELNKKTNFEVMLTAPYLLHGKKEGRTEVKDFVDSKITFKRCLFSDLMINVYL